MKNQHEFALYYSSLTNLIEQAAEKIVKIQDADLVHRIERVLRLKKAEEFILFDRYNHITCLLEQFENRKTVRIQILKVSANQILKPEIIVWLPVLKRDDLEEALYSLVELGANKIQLVMTQKIQRTWGGVKELDRLQRICIAAAEQSKNYAFPEIHVPISFAEFIQQSHSSTVLLFDVGGDPLFETLQELKQKDPAAIEVIVGPEADLTVEEKSALKKLHALVCALTPTVLRARQAIVLGVGALRSVLK